MESLTEKKIHCKYLLIDNNNVICLEFFIIIYFIISIFRGCLNTKFIACVFSILFLYIQDIK